MQTTVKNIFNDMYSFFFMEKITLPGLLEKYKDIELMKVMINNMDSIEGTDLKAGMKAIYQFFKNYTDNPIEEDVMWEKLMKEAQILFECYGHEWHKQVILELVNIIERLQKAFENAA